MCIPYPVGSTGLGPTTVPLISQSFFVIALRQDVSTKQLRDDLMTMLIAGHETTAATLTWALHELTRPARAPRRCLLPAAPCALQAIGFVEKLRPLFFLANALE